jgi:hypothetical protein
LTHRTIHLGQSPLVTDPAPVAGRLVDFQGERFYVIENVQELRPFLLTLASDSDHWLFAASNGALTAGRRSPATALFPYVTEDKVLDSVGVSGPVTSVIAEVGGRLQLWRPLRGDDGRVYRIVRRLYRNVLWNRLVMEEENLDLGLTFRAGWSPSDAHGFVRDCELVNAGGAPVEAELVDGFLNLLPAEVDDQLENAFSVLADAYKRSELVPGTRLGIFALQAQLSDRPMPREALRATTVWSHGLEGAEVLLDGGALARFERGLPLPAAGERKGARGAYLLAGRTRLTPGGTARWLLVADVARSQHQVAALAEALREPAAAVARVKEDVARGREKLWRIVASTDALQRTGDELSTAHHVANVLMNDMRGGVPAPDVRARDLRAFVGRMSPETAARCQAFLDGLPERTRRAELLARVEVLGDADLSRLALEYLPLGFSRRHGDPSRPWNRFDIRVKGEDGEERLAYQGNWRDIFQNWEALALSWPELCDGFVARFVNASTADGYNPYRVSSDGVDWEAPEPTNPWASIGYWGDHQLVYLQRLLERSLEHHPGALKALLRRPIFTYADVPYVLAPYEELLRDPRNTIRFDGQKHRAILERVGREGGDARLLRARGAGGVHRVTLVEKLLVPALAKLSNLVPGGGVWMNTQRPEWNDANNALVGYGLSVVTLAHLGSYLRLAGELFAGLGEAPVALSREVAAWAGATLAGLRAHRGLLAAAEISDADRGAFMAALGQPASAYREALYQDGLGAPAEVPVRELVELAELGVAFARQGVAGNRRADGLYHSYNLLVPHAGGAMGVEHMQEMLEGQAAVLGSGLVGPEEALHVLEALRGSAMYREDQRSYMLYPDRRLPGFLERNVVPEQVLRERPALARLLAQGDRIVRRDAAGQVRFREQLDGADRCREALDALVREGALDEAGAAEVLDAYEVVFRHRQFTGRSGTMFGYEGLGCIYWHMVGKLLVAVQERCFEAAEGGAAPEVVARLAAAYHTLREGMAGTQKTPEEYGAIPLDPYSHTPRHTGARQPGMTGQVKEEVLARMGELGVRVKDGRVRFWPLLLRAKELLPAPTSLEVLAVDGAREVLALAAGTLAFTLCQVPVVYRRAGTGAPAVTVVDRQGGVTRRPGDTLAPELAAEVFGRTGAVRRIEVEVAGLYEG